MEQDNTSCFCDARFFFQFAGARPLIALQYLVTLQECRARTLDRECGCLPYYYPDFEKVWQRDTTCNVTALQCISKITASLSALSTEQESRKVEAISRESNQMYVEVEPRLKSMQKGAPSGVNKFKRNENYEG